MTSTGSPGTSLIMIETTKTTPAITISAYAIRLAIRASTSGRSPFQPQLRHVHVGVRLQHRALHLGADRGDVGRLEQRDPVGLAHDLLLRLAQDLAAARLVELGARRI